MIIADTGFWLALANARDTHHKRARLHLTALNERLITTWPVMTETSHLLLNRLGSSALIAFMKSFEKGAFDVFDLRPEHSAQLTKLMQKYDSLPMDLADASLVILAEHLGHGRILSTDERDFRTYRFKHRKPFTNILFEK